ncbi:YadA-like family protein [Agrobacterium sp. O3.4]|uniref:YadA-like family protein n=1 Tax=Agrobacterium cucumeris TaxID=2862866 RepID=A0ABY8RSW2_9HYPH|nr:MULTISPECIES: YadA-like family protein [Rhizobium/Agrobacterium group]MCZ7469144.1 YadA-like family protein [Rhizobium rhizogenes]WHO10164.1 YadA-like family protein [Agrobacterium cucumeris]
MKHKAQSAKTAKEKVSRFAENWFGKNADSRFARRRLFAMLRMAYRVLGIKSRRGLGLLGIAAGLGLASASLVMANGIYINANTDGRCVSINDPQDSFAVGSPTFIQDATAYINLRNNAAECNSNNKATQTNSVLFYRPAGVNGVGATSLSLGGEIYVNGLAMLNGYVHIPMATLQMGRDTGAGFKIGSATTRTVHAGDIAIGGQASADGSVADGAAQGFAVAIGNNSEAIGTYALGVGTAAKARGQRSTAVGPSTQAEGYSALAAGRFAQAYGPNTTAVGRNAIAGIANQLTVAEGAVAVGYGARARAENAIALGRNALVEQNIRDAMALGFGATAENDFSVALGSNARTGNMVAYPTATLAGTVYNFAGGAPHAELSVGSLAQQRQITNVASGRITSESTDAINGSQLFAAFSEIGKTHSRVNDLETRMAALPAAGTNPGQTRVDESVRAAIGGGAVINEAGGLVMPQITLNSLGATVDGNGNTVPAEQPDSLLGAIAALDNEMIKNDRAIGAIIESALLWHPDKKAFDAERIVPQLDADGRQLLDGDGNPMMVRENGKITNLAPGALTPESSDAVTGGQLSETNDRVTDLATKADRLGEDSLLWNQTSGAFDARHGTSATSKISNIADGVLVNDAVNVGQLQTVALAASTAQTAADAAKTAADNAQASANATQTTADGAKTAADAAQGTADNALTAAGNAQTTADGAKTAADGARAAADGAKTAADAAQGTADNALAAAGTAQTTADGAKTTADGARAAADAAQGTADNALTAAGTAQTTADGAKTAADGARVAADGAKTAADAAQGTADNALAAAGTAQTTADGAKTAADGARAAADGAKTAADAAQGTADNALTAAGNAQTTADGAKTAADGARAAADAGKSAADAAQGTADNALASAGTAQTTADGARTAADGARAAADGAKTAADAAQGTADNALASAGTAQTTADGAKTAADGARAAADGAKTAADAAQGTADAALAAADTAGSQLAGIGANETVAGRIAGVGQSTANALGGGSSVNSDGTVTAPAYEIATIGADGTAQDPTVHHNVGDAISALDGNIDTVNTRVDDLADDSLLWSEEEGAFSASHALEKTSRIANVTAGVAETDAVNLGQLDTVRSAADAAQIAATAAQGTADTALRAAGTAQQAAQGAETAAGAAQTSANAAQVVADNALAAAGAAQNTADTARDVAATAQNTANAALAAAGNASSQLAGVGADETVVGRIADLGQSTADALGGGAAVNSDGTVTAPSYGIATITPDGTKQDPTAHNNVGDALSALDGNIDTVNSRVDNLAGDSLLWSDDEGAFSATHGNEKTSRIANVAAGVADTDAVNFGQLEAINKRVSDAFDLTEESSQQVDGLKEALVQALGGAAVLNADGSVAAPAYGIGTISPDGTVQSPTIFSNVGDALGSLRGNVEVVNSRIDNLADESLRWDAGEGAFSASHGDDKTNRVGNVAAGTRDTDAVNVGQLNVVSDATNDAQGTADGAMAAATAAQSQLVGIGPNETVAARIAEVGRSAANALGGGVTTNSDGTLTTPAYEIAMIGADGTTQGQRLYNNTGSALAALGDNIGTVNTRVDDLAEAQAASLTYDATPNGSRANSVTLLGGDPNAPVLIRNVAMGVDEQDGVNVRQLKQAQQELEAQDRQRATEARAYVDQSNVDTLVAGKSYADEVGSNTLTTSMQYTDQYVGSLAGDMNEGFNRLSSSINEVRGEARQAAAIGLAAASLRFDDRPGKLSLAVGAGAWRGAGAGAFGLGYTSETGNMRMNVSGVMTEGNFGVGAGLSFTLN